MKIVVFTGAGMSRDSGLLTYRDMGGLWNGHDVNEVCTTEAYRHQPQKVITFFNDLRQQVLKAEPHKGHKALAALESDHEVIVVTQNLDDLHERGGSSYVIHVHGEIMKKRSDRKDDTELLECREDIVLGDKHENGHQFRPHVVFYGEMPWNLQEAFTASIRADVLVVVGASLEVYPANDIVYQTGAKHVYVVDPNPPKKILSKILDYSPEFDTDIQFYAEPAATGVPAALEHIKSLQMD